VLAACYVRHPNPCRVSADLLETRTGGIEMNDLHLFIGRYFTRKYNSLYESKFDAARRLRKEGVPLAIALLILVGRV